METEKLDRNHNKEIIPVFHVKKRTLLAIAGCVDVFIAVFYTGLGFALTLAGVIFWVMFARYHS